MARISRDINIKSATPALVSAAPVMRRTVKESGAIMDTPAAFEPSSPCTGLTVMIAGNNIEVTSPYLGVLKQTPFRT